MYCHPWVRKHVYVAGHTETTEAGQTETSRDYVAGRTETTVAGQTETTPGDNGPFIAGPICAVLRRSRAGSCCP